MFVPKKRPFLFLIITLAILLMLITWFFFDRKIRLIEEQIQTEDLIKLEPIWDFPSHQNVII